MDWLMWRRENVSRNFSPAVGAPAWTTRTIASGAAFGQPLLGHRVSGSMSGLSFGPTGPSKATSTWKIS
eukprot:4239129-Heterocapsa_arctica.AAC.1